MDPILHIPVGPEHGIGELMAKEWLVTNGLGGYCSGTVAGINTRRHHGVLIANLPAPRGRTLMLPHVDEIISLGDKEVYLTTREFVGGKIDHPALNYLKEFHLDWQTPVWLFEIDGRLIEKKIFMPYGQNTTYISYQLLRGDPMHLQLRVYGACRKIDSQLGYPRAWAFSVLCQDERFEITAFEGAPKMHLTLKPFGGSFVNESRITENIFYRMESQRGLDSVENLFSPGYFSTELKVGNPIYFLASTENWEAIEENWAEAFETELARRKKLLSCCPDAELNILTAQLVLAADQFIILPKTRSEHRALLNSSEQARTIIAGYHWFTDWGRDTMISLEGLTLCTGRHNEAKAILKTFGHYVRNGLLPNHFPEGERYAIYNTVDATFWFFHAIDRYYETTHDKEILEILYPTLESIIECHVRGTDFGIYMDKEDYLISAAAEGFQLTWMDAKVDEWVVTPRRGKPVEIQALWYNALKLMEVWGELLGKSTEYYAGLSQNVFDSFNQRFWFKSGNYLYDVINSEKGDDHSLRPNQIFALSLRFPVLKQERWKPIVDIVEEKLLTPFGLRTLDRGDKHYHGRYEGDRWNRDAAYHQGLVWTWLIGPFIDAWKKVYDDPSKAREFFKAVELHLKQAGIGTISEIFDGDSPYLPRGCIAQAWSVAEMLRCLQNLQSK